MSTKTVRSDLFVVAHYDRKSYSEIHSFVTENSFKKLKNRLFDSWVRSVEYFADPLDVELHDELTMVFEFGGPDADRVSLSRDWYAVGDDIRSAAEEFGDEHEMYFDHQSDDTDNHLPLTNYVW